jgi:hypothetical protein
VELTRHRHLAFRRRLAKTNPTQAEDLLTGSCNLPFPASV